MEQFDFYNLRLNSWTPSPKTERFAVLRKQEGIEVHPYTWDFLKEQFGVTPPNKECNEDRDSLRAATNNIAQKFINHEMVVGDSLFKQEYDFGGFGCDRLTGDSKFEKATTIFTNKRILALETTLDNIRILHFGDLSTHIYGREFEGDKPPFKYDVDDNGNYLLATLDSALTMVKDSTDKQLLSKMQAASLLEIFTSIVNYIKKGNNWNNRYMPEVYDGLYLEGYTGDCADIINILAPFEKFKKIQEAYKNLIGLENKLNLLDKNLKYYKD